MLLKAAVVLILNAKSSIQPKLPSLCKVMSQDWRSVSSRPPHIAIFCDQPFISLCKSCGNICGPCAFWTQHCQQLGEQSTADINFELCSEVRATGNYLFRTHIAHACSHNPYTHCTGLAPNARLLTAQGLLVHICKLAKADPLHMFSCKLQLDISAMRRPLNAALAVALQFDTITI